MARIYTTDGKASVEVTMNDLAASTIAIRTPAACKDRGFAVSLCNAYKNNQLTQNRRVWLHIMAKNQLQREQPKAAPVASVPAAVPTLPAALPAPVEQPAAPLFDSAELDRVSANAALAMLMYDIPETAKVANPSYRIRQRGMRLNKSVWIVPTTAVPHNLINELREAGSSVVTAPYDMAASRTLLAAAIDFANREIAETHKRAQQSARAAIAEMDNDEGNPNAARRTCERKLANIVKRLQTLEGEMKVGADVFGLSGAINFAELHRAAATVRTVTEARSALFAAATAALGAINTTDAKALHAAAVADAVPPVVVADYLMEHGDEEAQATGEQLGAAMNDAGPNDQTDESDVFDLV